MMQQTPKFEALDLQEQDRLWNYVQAQFSTRTEEWLPLWLNGRHLGYLNEKWRQLVCRDWPSEKIEQPNALLLSSQDWLSMADNLQHMAQGWQQLGELDGWRNEKFSVTDEQNNTLFALERAAFRPLGLLSHAVHINGFTHRNGEWLFWIARRSPFKAVDPNKLDNLVGGGIAFGESIHQAMLREGWEEAGLSEVFLKPLSLCSNRFSLRAVSRGLHREQLHIFDAVLPEDITPENQDGEVADFMLMNRCELADAMMGGRLMNDALLATLDAFARYGLLDKSHPLSLWLDTLAC